MIDRTRHQEAVLGMLERFPVVALLGARQVGKTTLARQIAARCSSPVTVLDLEDPRDAARLADPMLALAELQGLIVIDEVQRHPGLFEVLRVLADRPAGRARFLLLGSAAPALLRQTSESLAGRIAHHELPGLSADEAGVEHLERLWVRGGFPRSYLAPSEAASAEWRREFVRTFLERDLPQLGVSTSSATLRRFWTMLAHTHGQIWNASGFSRSFGVSDTTVRRYLDVLASAFVVHQLHPWHENLRKRQVKSPKVYLDDSGLLHCLLNLDSRADVESHPKLGSSWEGFAINIIRARLAARLDECYFWASHTGAELDLLVVRGRARLGFEIKRTVSPTTTRSMHIALEDLKLDRLDVIHAGRDTYPLGPRIRAVSLRRIWHDLTAP